jgi:hypothetical protein
MVAGVVPVDIAMPLLFFSVKQAPGGLVEIVTGYCDLPTILQQAVMPRQTPPMAIRATFPRIRARGERDVLVFIDHHHPTPGRS